MSSFFQQLFDTSDFPARWTCGHWSPAHGWLHILSDVAIFGAYAAIPLTLTYFIRRRQDVPFTPLFWLFAAFIFACGFGHLVEATLFWHPWYRFSGGVKAVTAVVSWLTVIQLVKVLPSALALPGLAKVNRQLEAAIAERERAEGASRVSEEHYRLIAQNAQDVIWTMDMERRLTYVSPSLERALGYTAEELMRSSLEQFVTPESFASGLKIFSEEVAAARPQPVPEPARVLELEYRRKDGSTFWGEMKFSFFRDSDGRLTGVLGVGRDLTERKQAEATLARESQLLRTVIDHLPDYIYVKDREMRFLMLNAANLRLLKRDRGAQMLGKTVAEFVSPDQAQAFTKDDQQVMESGQAILGRHEPIDGQDGRTRWLLTTKVPLRDSRGQVIGLVGISRDITEQQSLEEQLRQAQKLEAIGTLAGGVAHDFNNILAAILGNAELALADTAPDHPARECLQAIKRAGDRAKRLVQQILAFSRQQPQERCVLALGPLMAEATSLLRATVPPDVQLVTSVAADAPQVLADPTQMHQVLINLCTNAWHALEGQPGRIEVRLQSVTLDADTVGQFAGLWPGRFACLSVSDTGQGMDDATLKRIFDPFFTTKAPGQGTGLGLSVVHGIVQEHDGAVTVASKPGRGATFQVYLPAVETTVGSAPAPTSPSPRG